jgi:hypothetical protein
LRGLANSTAKKRRKEKEENMHSNRPITGTEDDDERFDLDTLLHPANAFARPVDVVNDPDLTLSEKRAILRKLPGSESVRFDDIIDALRELDRNGDGRPIPHYQRVLAERLPGVFGRKSSKRRDDHGPSLN